MLAARCRRFVRKGISGLQTALVVGAIGLVVVVGLSTLGRNTTSDLNRTATNVADPTTLVNRWGGCPQESGDGDPMPIPVPEEQ